ncbi:MAG: SusD/RagB family nutrient-binding outer membrane lipoprotein [Bacteroides sp.]|nr:SusD/RagB family nutrient-binding outer membrane lipoprotein [Bacteroides sp.]
MKIYTHSLVAVLFLGLGMLSSCDDKLEEINKNPNALTEIDPEYLFSNGTYQTLRGNNNLRLQMPFGAQYGHYYTGKNNYLFIDRYWDYFEDGEYQTTFDDFYFGPIRLLEEAMRLTAPGGDAENEVRYAMTRMMAIVNYLRLADAWGSIPYLEGGKGQTGVVSPAYDAVEDIYTTMMDEIKTIIQVLTDANPSMGFPGADPLYDNDLEKWTRFANSFRLRMAMRARFVAPSLAEPIIQECLQGPLIEENSQNAWNENQDTEINELSNPIYGHYNYWQWGMSEFFVESLKAINDPRLKVFVALNDTGAYVGIPNGQEDQKLAEWGDWSSVSKPTDTLVGRAAPIYQMAAAEIWFLKAEAALYDIVPGNADSLYQEGIRQSFEQWTVSQEEAESYISTAEYATLSGSQEEMLEQISTQLWISFMSNEFEGWCNIRRTGYPVIAQRKAPDYSLGVTNGYLPTRLKYPVSETNINRANNEKAVEEQGPDEITTPLWWDVRD